MNKLQIQASDPTSSIWVSASAGTGKTKILTDRVLRLLLSKAVPHKILCITFTNAAAAEMKERINDMIFHWSKMNHEELEISINNIQGRSPTEKEIKIAKNLYEQHLCSENNISIQTIHSFCQKTLQQFPLEADISPRFQVIDETKEQIILSEVQNIINNKAELQIINEYLATNFHQLIIDEIFKEIIQNKSKILKNKAYKENKISDAIEAIKKLRTPREVYFSEFLSNLDLRAALGQNFQIQDLYKLFLTNTGEIRKRITGNAVAKKGSNLDIALKNLQEQFYQKDQEFKSLQISCFSTLISVLSYELTEEYNSIKKRKALLDYDDLIDKTSNLLCDSQVRQWVLYKLDGLIDHLLVDEAQDTSPNQWGIINALIEEFYCGDGKDSESNRTIFVVGDAKQSIFSFQGADVNIFAQTNVNLAEKMYHAKKPFYNVNLDTSYRSTSAILDVVYALFKNQQNIDSNLFPMPLHEIKAYRNNTTGLVELWPLSTVNQDIEKFWPVENRQQKSISAKLILANKIAKYVKELIDSKKTLPSTGMPIKNDDIMILFRKRDQFTDEVIKALQQNDVSVSGLDRIILKENISVQDLLSVARFVLNPYDDLNLGSLLKSPIILLNEEELYDIATKRLSSSIWKFIEENRNNYANIYDKLNYFQKVYKITNAANFFYYITEIMGYRKSLSEYNGPASDDAINELLYACSSYCKNIDDSLQNFIFWIDNNYASIKRESLKLNQVRIMTLHGAKGLQAPIVILCDTTTLPKLKERFFWSDKGDFVVSTSSNITNNCLKKIKSQAQKASYSEYLRLLYVGMTRAEDRLIVCGYQESKSVPENCWYQLVKNTLYNMRNNVKLDEKITYGQIHNEIKRTAIEKMNDKELECFNVQHDLNKIPNLKKDKKCLGNKYLTPMNNTNPMEYGIIFHKILEDSILAKDISKMSYHPLIKTLCLSNQQRIANSISAIQSNKQLNKLLSSGCLVETSVGRINQNNGIDLGRIDLMIEDGDNIIIIDYKSDLTPPKNRSEIPVSYLKQLENYRLICSSIYPNKKVITKILWLENGCLM
ncbi:MAG TPA: UvrD-helicase domain-containing protein [Candidatus Megaira endosymbiont of Nemacystus decipiens]|nr:UvrD-helicase domain-containing protein [Candidatus Megaera endosymbiont of Nemacystus decipiens]